MADVMIKPTIGEGKKAFIVCDESLKKGDAPFLKFLRSKGYTLGFFKGCFGCPWVHVDINTKQYAYGMPGVAITGAIGNHAITIDEFMIIYSIYEKYEGLGILRMNQKEQEEFDLKMALYYAKNPKVK